MDTSSPHGKGHSSPPTFRPMSIVVQRLPISATQLLFKVVTKYIIAGPGSVKCLNIVDSNRQFHHGGV